MNPDTLTLSRLRFFGHHGLLPQETKHGQYLEVTVRLELAPPAAGYADDLARSVDYRAVHAAVLAIMAGPPRLLAETLAEEIAVRLLAEFPPALAAEVELTKPNPPVDFIMAGFSVKLRRTRT